MTCKTCCWWAPNQEKPAEEAPDGKYQCNHPEVNIRTTIEFGCTLHLGADSTEMNVPQHTKNGITMSPNHKPVDGPVEILIVTYSKDFPWLVYALRCIKKHLAGFQGVTVAHPRHESEQFGTLLHQFDVRLHAYDEKPGLGMLGHMIKMAEADLIVPSSTKYVMHLDADCMFRMPTTPENYFFNDKPVYVIRTWDSLTTEDPRRPGSKVVSDCLMWKLPTEKQLGFTTEWYTMCRHPTVLPMTFYAPYRARIESVHRRPFSDYMLSGRNEWPQDRMDWTAMGAWARQFMYGDFHWVQVGVDPTPEDRQKAYWSHGGITPAIQAEIEGFLV